MMNRFLTILTLLTTFGSFSQRLIDVTSVQNISEYQNYTATNTDGISFFDFDEDGWDDLTYPMNNDSIIFYKNINGTFHKISSFILAEGIVRQMLWVDYDNNGSLDLFISYNQSELRLYKNDGNFNFTCFSNYG